MEKDSYQYYETNFFTKKKVLVKRWICDCGASNSDNSKTCVVCHTLREEE